MAPTPARPRFSGLLTVKAQIRKPSLSSCCKHSYLLFVNVVMQQCCQHRMDTLLKDVESTLQCFKPFGYSVAPQAPIVNVGTIDPVVIVVVKFSSCESNVVPYYEKSLAPVLAKTFSCISSSCIIRL